MGMRKRILTIMPILSCLMAGPAMAGWQYGSENVYSGWFQDDGTRFVISARGGASFGMAKIKNNVGALVNEYYFEPDTGIVISAAYYDDCIKENGCSTFMYAGMGELGQVSAQNKFDAFSFAAGASIGWTMPYRPQWRIEVGWDHISESEYNTSPLFEGWMPLEGGYADAVYVESSAVQSTVTTDIISAMAFYDFFDGIEKPLNQWIPYVGLGVGYADSKTDMNLYDPFGDLSLVADLQNFGELDDWGVLQFYKSTTNTSNIAGLAAVGLSYGISEGMYLDLGARVAYIPKIKWTLNNADNTRERDWFSAENVIYANLMLGVRFEF
jgi:opacity protein-like surface antigen